MYMLNYLLTSSIIPWRVTSKFASVYVINKLFIYFHSITTDDAFVFNLLFSQYWAPITSEHYLKPVRYNPEQF